MTLKKLDKFENQNDYYLYCYLGGIAEMQREIKLSIEECLKYNKEGIPYIYYLIHDLKNLHNCPVYNKAIEENRKII